MPKLCVSRPPSGIRTLAVFGPGLLLAATGVGAGDLATPAYAASRFGFAMLLPVLVGAALKFVLTEQIARWQIATGRSVVEGATGVLGPVFPIVMGLYLILFMAVVGIALVAANALTIGAALGRTDPTTLLIGGACSSLAAFLLARTGGYRLFERLMQACVGVMFLAVCISAWLTAPEASRLASELGTPTTLLSGSARSWTIAVMGGVGGTVTVLCYGYWMQESGRTSHADLRTCRIDLGLGYVVTGLFGIAMVLIARDASIDARGTRLIVALADRLGSELGEAGRWAFLAGAFGAVFSSMLGVWQAVPYIAGDLWSSARGRSLDAPEVRKTGVYRWSMAGMAMVAVVPLGANLPVVREAFGFASASFAEMQRAYAFTGAWFIPLLAGVMLVMNSSRRLVGEFRNGGVTMALLFVTVLAFALHAVL